MIGRLRHRVELQKTTQTRDALGGPSPIWATETTVWASIEPLSGSEQLRGMALSHPVTHRIRLRYRADIALTGDWRIKRGAKVYNIRSVINENERNRWWVLLAEEGVAT